jgi:hypothetical protein
MDNAITFKQLLMIMLGFGYLVNHRSREVHRVMEKHHNCHLDLIAEQNREYVTRKKAKRLIKDCGYNGCRWCWNPMDNG